MIKKLTTKEIMDIIDSSEEKIESLDNSVTSIQSELEKKLAVITEQTEYNSYQLENLRNSTNNNDEGTSIMLTDERIEGTYMKYGSSVHPAWVSEPTNVMNFQTAVGPIYKDNAEVIVSTNNEKDMNLSIGATDMLMHDAVKGKEPYLLKLNGDEVTIDIKINPGDLLGATSFNVIEVLPYLPGSFDITRIDVYTMLDFKTGSSVPSIIKGDAIPDAGATRIFLDSTAELYRCVMHCKLNYTDADGRHPFGLKHIYFLNANVNPNSSIIAPVTKNSYIDWISEDITIRDQNGVRQTTCTAEGIKIYSSNVNGELGNEIATTKGIAQNSLARNVKTIYVFMPVKKSISSIKFKRVATR